MFRFPNKQVREVYLKAIGRTFVYSPAFQKFTDNTGYTGWPYHEMKWLMDNNILIQLPWDPKFGANQYTIKEINHV